MNCVCGRQLIWGADFDYEDYGLEEEGIVSTYSCECGAFCELYLPSGAKSE